MEQIRIVYKRNVYKRLNSKSTKALRLNQTTVRGNFNSMYVIACADFQPNRISSLGEYDLFVVFLETQIRSQ